ncbi:hypothetical protein [Frankia sp. Mgl5]|uniref:hypothetical protein n=1 Tax=Frankia sp. Mgl5 TaxID=2933793 RepID=UPI0020104022|nr:hypothetical protein [Frankia sp. Mgl5]
MAVVYGRINRDTSEIDTVDSQVELQRRWCEQVAERLGVRIIREDWGAGAGGGRFFPRQSSECFA